MTDGSISFFSNKWRHHYITTTVKDFFVSANFLILSVSLLDFANKFKSTTP